jgi:hypothetical protein
LKVGWSSLKSDSPRQSPNTKSLITTVWYNEVGQLSRGEQLLSMCPFAVVKYSAWLVSKVSPHPWGSKSSYTEICYSTLPHLPVVVSLQYSTQKKHKGYKNSLFLIVREDLTTVQECLHVVKSSGDCNGWPASRRVPGCYNTEL